MKPASKKLVALAKSAAAAGRKVREANARWVAGFEREYGHDDISDQLVEAVDYGAGEITAEFIGENSEAGNS